MKPRVLSASSINGDGVVNAQGEDLGEIKDLMINLSTGSISYAVLSFGGFMGMGDKLFAVPWSSLELKPEEKKFMLNIPKERLENAPGFDKDDWPDFADPTYTSTIDAYYG